MNKINIVLMAITHHTVCTLIQFFAVLLFCGRHFSLMTDCVPCVYNDVIYIDIR